MNKEPTADLFGGSELAASGHTVSAIVLDSDVVILVGTNPEHEFRIENEFTVRDSECEFTVRYDPYNREIPIRENLTELSRIVTTTVLHARAYIDGVLELELSNGSRIRVEPKAKYEAWTYTFGNYILACPPGGFTV